MGSRAVLLVCLAYCGVLGGPGRAQDPRDSSRQAAVAFARDGRYPDAIAVLTRLVESDDSDVMSLMLLAQLEYTHGYFEAALKPLARLIELRPGDVKARVLRTVCLFKAGRDEEAAPLAQALLSREPAVNDIDLSLSYAEHLYERQQPEAALRETRRAVQFAPGHPISHLWLARLLIDKKQWAEAAAAAERSVSLAPDLPFARNLLVRIYRMQGRESEAQSHVEWLRTFESRKAGR